jgi:hypothetical protein
MYPETGDRAIIPLPRCAEDLGPGGRTMLARAEAAGIIKPHRTPTGREYLTPNEYEAAFHFARTGEAQKR